MFCKLKILMFYKFTIKNMNKFLPLLYLIFQCLTFQCSIFLCSSHKPRMWTRIPKFLVDSRVQQFLYQHRITNCYEFRESDTNLLLKCWKDEQLTDVSIEINPGKREQPRYYGLSISI